MMEPIIIQLELGFNQPEQEDLQETTKEDLFGGNYTLESEIYKTYSWNHIKDCQGQLVASIQYESIYFHHWVLEPHFLIIGRNRILLDLKKRTCRPFDNTASYWIEAYVSPDETTLLVIEECMDMPFCTFYDLTRDKITKLEAPTLSVYAYSEDNYEEDRSPSSIAYGDLKIEWQSDGRLIWTERRPYCPEMKMWLWEVENKINEFSSDAVLVNPEWIRICDERFCQLEQEKKEWRVHETTILKREGDKMVIVETIS